VAARGLSTLAEIQHLMIEAGGDAFTVDRLQPGGRLRGSGLTDASERVEQAESLLRPFSRRG